MIIQLFHRPKLAANIPFADAYALLSLEEKNTANAITSSTRLNEFIYGRYSLKMALAKHLNTQACNVILLKEPQGKLYLQHNPTFFNLTHSGEYIAFCICDKGPVGIDIEHAKKNKPNLLAIAKRYFSDAEYQTLEKSCSQELNALFYKIWTLKEAAFKATGLGISAGLDQLNTLNIKPNQAYSLTLEKNHYALWFNHWANPLDFANINLATALACKNSAPTTFQPALSIFNSAC